MVIGEIRKCLEGLELGLSQTDKLQNIISTQPGYNILGAALQLNSQAIGHAIDEGIVGRYGAYIVDGPVVKSLRAQRADVRFNHFAWRAGEFSCIMQHGKISCL